MVVVSWELERNHLVALLCFDQVLLTDWSNLSDKISGHWDSVLLAEIVITALTTPYS